VYGTDPFCITYRAALPILAYVKSIGILIVVESLFRTVKRESRAPVPSSFCPTSTL
jgi:hypothetical protein